MTQVERFVWGASSQTHPEETRSGDAYLVTEFSDGVLVAVIDALGHGRHAADTAETATKTLEAHAHESPVALMARCHTAMRTTTRGAAISLASFDWRGRTMAWLGIGNVSGTLLRSDADLEPRVTSLIVRAGVVGRDLPELHASVIPFAGAMTLVMTTDGVHGDYARVLSSAVAADPKLWAKRIVDSHARGDDDATALVFRCHGDRRWM